MLKRQRIYRKKGQPLKLVKGWQEEGEKRIQVTYHDIPPVFVSRKLCAFLLSRSTWNLSENLQRQQPEKSDLHSGKSEGLEVLRAE